MRAAVSFLTLSAILGILAGLASEVFCSKILVFHGVSSYSHRVQTWPIANALADRGHNVSYLAPYYAKKPDTRISEFVPKDFAEYMERYIYNEYNVNIRIQNKMRPVIESMLELAYNSYEILLSSPELQEWLKEHKKNPFDLVIIDNVAPEAGIALAHIMGAKYIMFNTQFPMPQEADVFGFLPPSSAIPEMETYAASSPLDFFGRVSNTLLSLKWRYHHYRYTARMDSLIKRTLDTLSNMPSVDDLLRKANLVFATGNVVADYPRSLPPLYVDVSGVHVKDKADPLPKDMEQFISSNKAGMKNDGFIYISFGSIVISSQLPDRIVKIFFDVIKANPNLRFLWKWNGQFPAEIPDNLMMGEWFPQGDLLAHPKIRGFVTQCGRPSALEALWNGVKMIAFPVLGDQDLNVNRLNETGAAIKLELGEVTFEQLQDAVQSVAYDPNVKAKMTKLQRIFHDQPKSPIETAVWWTEYVLRSEDTAHLQPYGNEQYWFVRRQVDVWAFFTVVILGLIITIVKTIIKLMKIFGRQPSQPSPKKKVQ